MHDAYVIGVMVRGVEALNHRGCKHLAPAGSVLMINPGEWHANYGPDEEGFGYRMLYPSVDLLRRFATEIAGSEQDAPTLGQPAVVDDKRLCYLLLRLHLTLERGASSLEQETCFVDAVAHLLSYYSAVPPKLGSPKRGLGYIKRVRDYLESNYADNFSLTELSRLTGISPFHMLRMFREEVGLPPHEYQTNIRISHAKQLLREGRSAGYVAAEVGFADQSHLTRHFKRIVGLTPGQFSPHRKNVQDY